MKPFTDDSHGRDHNYGCKDSKVPKRSKDRRGTRTPIRQKANNDVKKEIHSNENWIINVVTQTEKLNCVSACLSMVTNKDIDDITKDFDKAYHNQKLEIHEYLTTHDVPYERCMADTRGLLGGKVYIAHAPSLNMPGYFHAIVIEMSNDGSMWIIHDPNNGREDGRRYYDGGDEPLNGYSPDYMFDKRELEDYWNR